MEPIRVLQDIVWMNTGGLETLVMNLYRHVDHDRFFFDFLLHRDEETFYEPEIKSLGGKIYRTCPFNPAKLGQYKKENMKILLEHPEHKVIHVHQDLKLWTLQYAHEAGIPTRIAHSHNAKTVLNLKYFFFRYQTPRLSKHATDMFMCSTPSGEFIYGKKAVDEGKVTLIKNGIEAERFRFNEQTRAELRQELGFGDKLVIGHVGRFDQPKNHRFLLEVFSVIHKRNPDTLLALCGAGDTRDEVEKHAQTLGISDSVKFLGVRGDVNRVYQAFDFFLFPSLWEGLPLTSIEAQTAGLPILMSDVITNECIVTDNVQQMSLNESADKWADKVFGMLNGYKRADQYSNTVKSGFDIRETAQWLQAFYEKRTLEARLKK